MTTRHRRPSFSTDVARLGVPINPGDPAFAAPFAQEDDGEEMAKHIDQHVKNTAGIPGGSVTAPATSQSASSPMDLPLGDEASVAESPDLVAQARMAYMQTTFGLPQARQLRDAVLRFFDTHGLCPWCPLHQVGTFMSHSFTPGDLTTGFVRRSRTPIGVIPLKKAEHLSLHHPAEWAALGLGKVRAAGYSTTFQRLSNFELQMQNRTDTDA
ncbi:hypothetical protein Q8F55_003827 [Vanrija albida]|uniref:Uncharacterized protein n=1 Tax=Vanrija albida TaxID=181172 RepID=A0ABR3Q579_9TREE